MIELYAKNGIEAGNKNGDEERHLKKNEMFEDSNDLIYYQGKLGCYVFYYFMNNTDDEGFEITMKMNKKKYKNLIHGQPWEKGTDDTYIFDVMPGETDVVFFTINQKGRGKYNISFDFDV